MKLAYQAFDTSGKAQDGVYEAGSVSEASEALRAKGLFVTQIVEAAAGSAGSFKGSTGGGVGGRFKFGPGKGKRMKTVAMSTRQLQVLVSTGTPLADALEALERQANEPHWKEVVTDIRKRVERGEALSEAMAAHPRYFDIIYRSLVEAGESGGKLAEMLERLAKMRTKELQIRGSIIGAMTYPAILITVAVGALIMMITVVLPQFEGMFESLDVPMPTTTVILMAVSDAIRSWWWVWLIGMIAAAVGLKFWLRTSQGRALWDTALVRTPPLANVVRALITARLTRLLGVLNSGQVPLLDSLALVRQAAGNRHYADLISNAERHVERGEPMSLAFDDTQLIDPSVYEAVRNGENTGQVATLLLMISDFLDEENDTLIRSLTSILEPVILLVLGLVIGVVAVSMFLPLFDLTAMAGA